MIEGDHDALVAGGDISADGSEADAADQSHTHDADGHTHDH
jgi:hypothetical protein